MLLFLAVAGASSLGLTHLVLHFGDNSKRATGKREDHPPNTCVCAADDLSIRPLHAHHKRPPSPSLPRLPQPTRLNRRCPPSVVPSSESMASRAGTEGPRALNSPQGNLVTANVTLEQLDQETVGLEMTSFSYSSSTTSESGPESDPPAVEIKQVSCCCVPGLRGLKNAVLGAGVPSIPETRIRCGVVGTSLTSWQTAYPLM